MTTPEHVTRARQAHHAALASLSIDPKADGLKLWRKLRAIEQHVTKATEAYCNGDSDTDACDQACNDARNDVREILGKLPNGFFVNRDPRGYALKIDPDNGTVPEGMHQDWGRYGILAPVID